MRTLRKLTPVNAGSMADIAFLLLIFFFMTTTIQNEKGLTFLLPPPADEPPKAKIQDRNLFKVLINSQNEILVEGERLLRISKLKTMAREFVVNPNQLEHLSENPQKAIISLKAARGSDYQTYIAVLDQLKGAYYQIYGDRAGLSADSFRNLNLSDPHEKSLYLKARQGVPMNISLAEN